MKNFLLALVWATIFAIPCQAGFFSFVRKCNPCPQCGCGQLKKVCRLVPDTKKVTQAKYTVDEEEVCLFGKSCTEERIVEDPCAPCGQRCETVQSPRCGRIVCKKKLKKTTTTVEKPGFKCVLETVCCQCGCNCDLTDCVQVEK
jgi:hypothetical protein